jgi:outer membrane protein TolC
MPTLSFNYQSFTRDNAADTLTGSGTDAKLYLIQPLYSGSRTKNTVQLAKTTKHVTELELMNVKRNLYSDITRAFYALAQTDSDMKNLDETIDLMTNRQTELSTRVRLGKSRESEMFMLESQVAVLLSNKQKLSGDRQKSVQTLAFLTGASADAETGLTIVDDMTEPAGPVTLVQTMIEGANTRSDLQQAADAVTIQNYRVSIINGGLFPTLDLNSSVYSTRSGSASKWDLYLLLSMPLFQQGITRSRINEEKSRLDEITEYSAFTRRQAETEIKQLHSAYESSLAQSVLLKDAYNKSKKSYNIQLKDYGLGLVNNLDVIQATLTLLDVKSSLDRTILQTKLNKILLDLTIR